MCLVFCCCCLKLDIRYWVKGTEGTDLCLYGQELGWVHCLLQLWCQRLKWSPVPLFGLPRDFFLDKGWGVHCSFSRAPCWYTWTLHDDGDRNGRERLAVQLHQYVLDWVSVFQWTCGPILGPHLCLSVILPAEVGQDGGSGCSWLFPVPQVS